MDIVLLKYFVFSALLLWSGCSLLEVAVKLLRSIVQLRGQVVDAIQTLALLDSKAANSKVSISEETGKVINQGAYLLEGVISCEILQLRPRQ